MQELTAVPVPALERPRFVSTVVSVHVGETMTVTRNNTIERARFIRINCPETDQSFGIQAMQLTRQLAVAVVVVIGGDAPVARFLAGKPVRLISQCCPPTRSAASVSRRCVKVSLHEFGCQNIAGQDGCQEQQEGRRHRGESERRSERGIGEEQRQSGYGQSCEEKMPPRPAGETGPPGTNNQHDRRR